MSLTNRRISRLGIFGLALVMVSGFKALLTLFLGNAPDPVSLWVMAIAYGLGITLTFWSFTRRVN